MTVAVFFPSLMGVGIIASGMVLLSDLVMRALPNRGRRRSHRVALGAYGVVAAAAAAAGKPILRSHLLDRVPRRRAAYALGAVLAMAAGVAVAGACLAAHRDPIGVFHGSPWMTGIAVAAVAIAGLVTIPVTALAVLGDHLPRPLALLVTQTFLGRLQIPVEIVPTNERKETP